MSEHSDYILCEISVKQNRGDSNASSIGNFFLPMIFPFRRESLKKGYNVLEKFRNLDFIYHKLPMTGLDSSSLDTRTLCSEISDMSDEQLFGTATQAEVWFILEHNQVYGAKAVEESELPEVVKAHLDELVKTTPGSRVQLIKRDNIPSLSSISFFACLTFEAQPQIYEFHLSNYAELVNINLQKIVSGSPDYSEFLRTEPLYLVCTNGKRDPCCVKFGFSFYNSLHNKEPGNTWQTSHVGGHRFAANLVCFPHGLFYGRMSEDNAQDILKTYRREEILLEKYRGRSCFPEPVQAAEYYLRAQTGEKAINAFSLARVKSVSENRWEIVFVEDQSKQKHRLVISGVPSKFSILKSCRDLEKSQVKQFQLEDHHLLGS